MTEDRDDDLVPASVRLGNVVPPEDPEDWTKPLTWAAAFGIIAAPMVATAWFVVAPPAESEPMLGTWVVAAALAAGAALTGSTQIGRLRAATASLGAGLLAALLVVIAGTSLGARAGPDAFPAASQAILAAAAGAGGSVAAGVVAPLVAGARSRATRFTVAAIPAGVVALLLIAQLG